MPLSKKPHIDRVFLENYDLLNERFDSMLRRVAHIGGKEFAASFSTLPKRIRQLSPHEFESQIPKLELNLIFAALTLDALKDSPKTELPLLPRNVLWLLNLEHWCTAYETRNKMRPAFQEEAYKLVKKTVSEVVKQSALKANKARIYIDKPSTQAIKKLCELFGATASLEKILNAFEETKTSDKILDVIGSIEFPIIVNSKDDVNREKKTLFYTPRRGKPSQISFKRIENIVSAFKNKS